MKTNELIKKAEALGFIVEKYDPGTRLEFHYGNTSYCVASMPTDIMFTMDTDYSSFSSIPADKAEVFLDLLYKYAKTPLEEREEQKKFYLRTKGAQYFEGIYHCLNRSSSSGQYFWNTTVETVGTQTKFTEDELAEMPPEILEICDKIAAED